MQSCSSIAKADDEWPSQTDPPLCPSVVTVVVAVVVVVGGGGGPVVVFLLPLYEVNHLTIRRFHIFFPFLTILTYQMTSRIQFRPDPPNIIRGCPNFSLLWTFWSGHSFCLKNSFYFLKNLFSLHLLCNSSRLSKLCQMKKTLSNPVADLLNRVCSCIFPVYFSFPFFSRERPPWTRLAAAASHYFFGIFFTVFFGRLLVRPWMNCSFWFFPFCAWGPSDVVQLPQEPLLQLHVTSKSPFSTKFAYVRKKTHAQSAQIM